MGSVSHGYGGQDRVESNRTGAGSVSSCSVYSSIALVNHHDQGNLEGRVYLGFQRNSSPSWRETWQQEQEAKKNTSQS